MSIIIVKLVLNLSIDRWIVQIVYFEKFLGGLLTSMQSIEISTTQCPYSQPMMGKSSDVQIQIQIQPNLQIQIQIRCFKKA